MKRKIATKPKPRRRKPRPPIPSPNLGKQLPSLPPALFECTNNGQAVIVIVPARILDSERARIVGREWGPANQRLKWPGWCYWLVAANATTSAGQFAVSEQELVEWQP